MDTSTHQHPARPTPVPYYSTQHYWEEAAAGRLSFQGCDRGHVQFYPRAHCRYCGSRELTNVVATGRGTVHTFSVVHRAADDAFAARLPYVFAMVDLDEGPRMTANIVNVDPEQVRIGMVVEAIFDDTLGDITLPQFQPSVTSA